MPHKNGEKNKNWLCYLQVEWDSSSKFLTLRTISPSQYMIQVHFWKDGYVALDPHSGDVIVPLILLPLIIPPQLAIKLNQFGIKMNVLDS